MDKPVMKARLWLPWTYKLGDKEVRLSSEDVYDTLNEARKGLFFLIESKGANVEQRVEREKHLLILQTIEDGLRSMFGQALKETPKFMIPGRKP